MPDLQANSRQLDEQIGAIAQELLRIEAHLRRGESRAASARIGGARQQLSALRSDASAVFQSMLGGARLGLMAGTPRWLRGRLPATVIGAIGGWMYGQSVQLEHQRTFDQLDEHIDFLEEQLVADDEPSETPDEPAERG